MIGVDTNILVDLMVSSVPGHESSRMGIAALEDELCTTPTNIGECLRVLTHPKIFTKPLSVGKATALLEKLIAHYGIRLLEEDPEWWKALPEMERLIPGLRGNEVFDARIALTLRANGVKHIYTRDADFRKYGFLKVISMIGSSG